VNRADREQQGELANLGTWRACKVARWLEIRGHKARVGDAAQLASRLESEMAQVAQSLSDCLREVVP